MTRAEKIEAQLRWLLEEASYVYDGCDPTYITDLHQACAVARAALASPEVKPTGELALAFDEDGAATGWVKPTGEGERCVTCGGAGCMNVLGEFADDDRTEVCPRCHGYGKTP